MQNKNILLGLSGTIASYKAYDLISALVKKGYEVKVVLTQNALNFVTVDVLQALTRNKVYIEQFSDFFLFLVRLYSVYLAYKRFLYFLFLEIS